MKRMMMVAVILFATAPHVLGPDRRREEASAAAPQQSGVESTLTQMEHDLAAAILKRNVAAIDPMLASDFALTGPDGNVQERRSSSTTSSRALLRWRLR